ncbi:MAG: HEPN domain-containing protein [Candidatus Sericytochromatia bacterium]|nr:HEPN domain-containing protein [Candidatus Tanganyikabacteria bacterium]
MKNSEDLARGWLRKAQSDLQTAVLLGNSEGPYDTACFHAQQAAEKALKALLSLAGSPIPRTHSLADLALMCRDPFPGLTVAGEDLACLTPYAVELRYDFEFWPEADVAAEAVLAARRIVDAVSALVAEYQGDAGQNR